MVWRLDTASTWCLGLVVWSCGVSGLRFLENKKAPQSPAGLSKSGIDLLSHPQKGSTISANGLNFSVRNGKRWILTAITTAIYYLREKAQQSSDLLELRFFLGYFSV